MRLRHRDISSLRKYLQNSFVRDLNIKPNIQINGDGII